MSKTRHELREEVGEVLHEEIELTLDAMENQDTEEMWARRKKVSTILNHLCGAVEEVTSRFQAVPEE